MTKKFKQAYQLAPWRRQFRSFGLSVLPVIALGIGIALYLVVSAQSAAAGLQIMQMHYDEEEILRQIAIERTELGWITSYKEMQQRISKMGYPWLSRAGSGINCPTSRFRSQRRSVGK
jgi:hypothetical protein